MLTLLGLKKFESNTLILATALWLVLFCNFTFFSQVIQAYPLRLGNLGFILSLAGLLLALTVVLLAPVSSGRALKPVLITMLLMSAATAYFMDTYNVIISTEIVESTIQTDAAESMGVLSPKLFVYLALFGVLPSVAIYKASVNKKKFSRALFSRLKLVVIALIALIAILAMFSSAYASFFREHKAVRYYTNPVSLIYAVFMLAQEKSGNDKLEHQQIGLDAKVVPASGKRKLLVLVVGETARADRFSLNGYARETNPLLAQREVTTFDNMWSCGTATAVSVPCMFSELPRANYSERVAKSTDNVLDIAQRAGVNVIWLDNNSDSKGVALRVPYVSYRNRETNPLCDTECRDEGMLAGVKKFISEHDSGNILVVLHQMGSHGPEYAKRYPEKFEYFSPSCHSNQLDNCSQEEINNAYDNSIRYTDYFLSKVIDLLKTTSDEFSPAMLYLSDHGESLGDSGVYLHGFPYALAPEEQKHVPMIFWSGDGFEREKARLANGELAHRAFSQDNLFHSLLGLLNVQTSVYQPAMDIFGDQ